MSEKKLKLIWDIPTRFFHWLLVTLIAYSWYSAEIADDLETHLISGYCILTLIIFRIVWGFIGPRYARFSNFLYKPAEIASYSKTFLSKQKTKYAGHNPLGGLAVVMMLLLVTVQAGTGLFANDEDHVFAPLSHYVSSQTASILTKIHHLNFNILLTFIFLHIITLFFYLFYKKENLMRAMLTGKKEDEGNYYEAIPHSKLISAVILIMLVAAGVYCLVEFT